MAQTKQDKSRKDKKDAFKEKAKTEAAQANIPKTNLTPITNWETTDVLDLGGDLLEVLESQMVAIYNNIQSLQGEFNKAAQVMQQIMSRNIKADKIKLTYKWNNGEAATEAEVADFKARMEQIRAAQIKQVDEVKQQSNAAKTGLVDLNGSPVGTDQDLTNDEEE